MSLTPGSRLGPYEILAPIGAGGMGEVWRATDTKLGREVAIKILPDAFAQDADRMARFTREAQVLASLNHPNIAQIYSVEDRALVMELVEGENLQGPLPLEVVLNYARQIADALEAAHEKGIVHRDLKPANIKVKPDGTIKVLDFGLAKPAEQSSGDSRNSPTLTISPTVTGMIMGTAAYMSPEQAAGKTVDKRSDIWSFGVVLWEMLTGRRLFEGETISHTLADVLRGPIELATLPKNTPPPIRNLIGRCLDRDIKKRLRDIGEARIALEGPIADAPEAGPRGGSRLPWVVAAILLIFAAALGFMLLRETRPEAAVIRTLIAPPDRTTFNFSGGLSDIGPVALSPDARRMTFSARGADGRTQLWIRPLDALTAQPLPGTEAAIHPFWSPDSRFIAFFAGGRLKKVDTSGGPPVTLCEAASGRGGTWNEAGIIVFAPTGAGVGLQRVPASGGVPAAIGLDMPGRWPWFLPDGRHFVYSSGATVRLGSLDSRETRVLVETVSDAVYTQGHLLYLREETLMAHPFDTKRLTLTGEAVPIAENVRSTGALRRGIFSVSQNGMLVYQSGAAQGRFLLTWFDRAGTQLGTLGEASDSMGVFFSPDRRTVATCVLDPASHTRDVWLYDVARGLRTRFTFGALAINPQVSWSPDGSAIAFQALRNGKYGLYRKAANLSGSEDLLYADDVGISPTSWSPDGKTILYLRAGDGTFALPLTGERKPIRVVAGAVLPYFARFSPDGRWVAYVSPESQRLEVYVVPFPGPGGKVQISTTGGTQPHWRDDGKEIYYVAPDGRMMAVKVRANSSSLEVEGVQRLFGGVPTMVATSAYDVALDGQRFLIAMPSEPPAPEPLTLVQNWTVGLKK